MNRARPSGTPDVTNVQTSPGGKRVDIPNVRKRVCLGGSAPSEPPQKIKVEVIDADSRSESRVARPGPSSSFTDSDVSGSSDKEPHLDSSDEVVLVKSELKTGVLSRQHRFDNRAPLWHAEPSVKKEVDEAPRKKRSKMDFDRIGVPKNKKTRNEINAAIDQYKKLNVDDRESYLNARMRINKNDGSVFPGLKGQNEVIAAKNIQQWEILGHYAGERLSDNTYVQGARAAGASLRKIDSYSYGLKK